MHAFRSYIWPKLTNAAAQFACDSGPSPWSRTAHIVCALKLYVKCAADTVCLCVWSDV